MDFDSIIPFLLLILFFILPSILKRLNQKKKPSGSTLPGKTKKLSLFEKLGEQIQEYVQNLEQETKKEKQPQENYWDYLADGEQLQTGQEAPLEKIPDANNYYVDNPVVEPPVLTTASKIPEEKLNTYTAKSEKPVPTNTPFQETSFDQVGLPYSQLQRAIIWSEILSKPIALREERRMG
ncbi:MAG: hypothetical protein GY710_09860 [Desulfobacteraceae bacterium]|nr:hypothetical protein [Desulfobacteraceae bacterium]